MSSAVQFVKKFLSAFSGHSTY